MFYLLAAPKNKAAFTLPISIDGQPGAKSSLLVSFAILSSDTRVEQSPSVELCRAAAEAGAGRAECSPMKVQTLDTAAGNIISGGDAWVTEWTSWSECRLVRRVECPAAENRSTFALGWRTRQRFCFSLSANSEATLGSSACATSNTAFFERQACFPENLTSNSTEKLDGVLSALIRYRVFKNYIFSYEYILVHTLN